MAVVKTRTLTDLFSAGRVFTVEDGHGDPVTVYLQKLTPLDNETAVRRANAVRATIVIQGRDKESEVYLNALNELLDYSEEDLLTLAVEDELARRSEAIEAEWAADAEWNDGEYLQGIWDRWQDPMIQEGYFVAEGEPRDPESERIFDELQRYSDELAAEMEKHRKHIRDEFSRKSYQQLIDMMLERTIKMQGDLTWMLEYRKCQVWLGVRKSEKDRTRYFKNRHEVDELASETLQRLVEAVTELEVPVDQGKESAGTDPSSNSSESPEPLEEQDTTSSPKE